MATRDKSGSPPHEEDRICQNNTSSVPSNRTILPDLHLQGKAEMSQDDHLKMLEEGEVVEILENDNSVLCVDAHAEETQVTSGPVHRQDQNSRDSLGSTPEPTVTSNITELRQDVPNEGSPNNNKGQGKDDNNNSMVKESSTLDLETTPSSILPGQESHDTSMPAKNQPMSLDVKHVQPSIPMSPQEFYEAKTIILDLLGWGVPTEYLLCCGLARESIYYVFTALNLRLPKDFNTDGIMPLELLPPYDSKSQ